jgi:hypothetical protein
MTKYLSPMEKSKISRYKNMPISKSKADLLFNIPLCFAATCYAMYICILHTATVFVLPRGGLGEQIRGQTKKVCKLATVCLPWQHWTKALVWFDDTDISAFHSCVVVDL